jgi:hypothetical protein
LGFPLPPFLQRFYVEVANGGFGPGAGLVGVDGGHTDVDGRTIGTLYADLRGQGWPDGLLPLCDWGGGAWAGIEQDERIVTVDEAGATMTRFTLRSWLEAWLSGTNLVEETFEIEHRTITNPFTKKPMVTLHRGRAKGQD